jgi:hypothetical protein
MYVSICLARCSQVLVFPALGIKMVAINDWKKKEKMA